MRALILSLLISTSAFADSFQIDPIDVTKVYDGDTFTVNLPNVPAVFGNEISVRIKGIDSPEIRTTCAYEKEAALLSRSYLTRMLESGQTIYLTNVERDKYFRLLADVSVDGADVATVMISSGHAIEYNGGTKSEFCR